MFILNILTYPSLYPAANNESSYAKRPTMSYAFSVSVDFMMSLPFKGIFSIILYLILVYFALAFSDLSINWLILKLEKSKKNQSNKYNAMK